MDIVKITKQEFLAGSGIDPAALCIWLEEEWLIPDGSSGEMLFSDIDVARAGLVRDLRDRMGVNDVGVGLVLDLVDQLHGMRRTLLELRHAIRETST
jgi:chaperone modulatory protein CbpM